MKKTKLNKNRNQPFSLAQIKQKVNSVGKTFFPKIAFIKDTGKRIGNNRLIEIKNLTTKERKLTDFGNLVNKGCNPWNQKVDRHEKTIIHPKIKKELLKMNLQVEQEIKISKRSRVDFICTNKKGKKIIVEVKSDKKKHSSKSLTSQINKYRTDGKKKFGSNYLKTYLVSLNGTYGYSIAELKLILKQDGFL